MGLIEILVVLLVLCVVGWLLFNYIAPLLPSSPPIRQIFIVIIVIIACLILLSLIGIGPGIRL